MKPQIDLKFYDENSFLSEKDYYKLTNKAISNQRLGDVRITKIRRTFNPIPCEYPDYIGLFQALNDSDPDLKINSICLYFRDAFSSSFFPSFLDEYFQSLSFSFINRSAFSWKTFLLLEEESYPSVTFAKYELEEAYRPILEKINYKDLLGTEDYTISPTFYFFRPIQDSQTFDIHVFMAVHLIF